VDLPDMDLPDVDLPNVDLPYLSAGMSGVAASIDAGVALPDVDLPYLSAGLSGVAAVANTNYPDDLTVIKGIGRVYETRLYRAGIYTWDQIAHMDPAALEQITTAIEAANVEDWPIQAQTLAATTGRMGARYDGPLPDKFSKLQGIGENAEQQLYRAGIFTYAQLAALTPEELAATLPASRGNFKDWITQAAASI
jgi:predicted flap endonuclease-1-like 5' DNA nuclease